jgi:hypothetical protein
MAPDFSFGINFSLNLMAPADPRVLEVIDNLDYVMDEAGFTNWGYGMPTPLVWDQISTWIEEIQTRGKQYQTKYSSAWRVYFSCYFLFLHYFNHA